MTTTFLQRSVIIFAVFLCCFQSWVNAINCELYPYHYSCRGSMTRKRAMPLNYLRTSECDNDDDCRIPKIKLLIALLDDNLNKDSTYGYYPSNYDTRHKKRKNRYSDQRPMTENLMLELKNMDSDY